MKDLFLHMEKLEERAFLSASVEASPPGPPNLDVDVIVRKRVEIHVEITAGDRNTGELSVETPGADVSHDIGKPFKK